MPAGTRTVVFAAAVSALVGALAAVAALAMTARVAGPVVFEMGGLLPRSVASGFYPPELDRDLTFEWTAARADLTLAGLDRSRPWRCTVRLRAARSAPLELPRVDLSVDGLTATAKVIGNTFEDLGVDLPVLAGRSGARLSIAATPTFVPGPSDRRTLGVQIDRIACAPTEGAFVPPPQGTYGRVAAAAAAIGAAAGLAGVPTMAAASIAVLGAAAQTVPLETGPAAYAGFALVIVKLAVGIALALLIGLKIVETWRRVPLAASTRAMVMLAGVLLYAQLLGLLHPSKPLVDAVFHAHRFDAVLAGHYFFTQPMPSGVSFPYAIGLYVFAAPWAGLTRDHVSLLRMVVCATDLAAYLLLYWIVVRTWGDRLVAAMALVLALMLPIAFDVIGNANLTNEFGHAVSVATIALASAWPARRWRALHAAGLVALCTLGFVSHVSTIALLACTLLAMAALYWWRGDDGRSRAATLSVVTAVAAVLAVLLYYGHFGDVYAKALRVRTGAAAAASAAPAAPASSSPGALRAAVPTTLAERLVDAAGLTVFCFGWPLLALAVAGVWRVTRGPRGDPLALLVGACGVAFVVFVGVGVMRVSPEFQRYAAEFITRVALATSPGLILLAAAGAASGLRAGVFGRAFASVFVAWAIVIGVQHWVGWFA